MRLKIRCRICGKKMTQITGVRGRFVYICKCGEKYIVKNNDNKQNRNS